MYVHVHTYIYIYIYVHICIETHIYIYIYVYTYLGILYVFVCVSEFCCNPRTDRPGFRSGVYATAPAALAHKVSVSILPFSGDQTVGLGCEVYGVGFGVRFDSARGSNMKHDSSFRLRKRHHHLDGRGRDASCTSGNAADCASPGPAAGGPR